MRLALRGRRNLDGGDEAIDDRAARTALRRRGQRILAVAVVVSAALTAALLAI